MENVWNKATVPHKDWVFVGMEDLGVATHTCDMCSKENIRYVHTLTHDVAGLKFKVGGVCASHMLNISMEQVKEREREFKNGLKRAETARKKAEALKARQEEVRQLFFARFAQNEKGNHTLFVKGHRFTIFASKRTAGTYTLAYNNQFYDGLASVYAGIEKSFELYLPFME